MLYNTYELQRTILGGAAAWASIASEVLTNPSLPFGYFGFGPVMASALDVFAHATAPRGKPAFDIETVELDGKSHRVTESIVMHKPFANLLRRRSAGVRDLHHGTVLARDWEQNPDPDRWSQPMATDV